MVLIVDVPRTAALRGTWLGGRGERIISEMSVAYVAEMSPTGNGAMRAAVLQSYYTLLRSLHLLRLGAWAFRSDCALPKRRRRCAQLYTGLT